MFIGALMVISYSAATFVSNIMHDRLMSDEKMNALDFTGNKPI
jgi:hypothetical protein